MITAKVTPAVVADLKAEYPPDLVERAIRSGRLVVIPDTEEKNND